MQERNPFTRNSDLDLCFAHRTLLLLLFQQICHECRAPKSAKLRRLVVSLRLSPYPVPSPEIRIAALWLMLRIFTFRQFLPAQQVLAVHSDSIILM